MRDDLVPEEVEIDPFVRAAAFPAAEQAEIETARLVEIADGEGEVEARSRHVERLSAVHRERSKARG
ncbi:MAG TPA: hypothetical protein VHT03_14325 [Rhizomicrobium sp.]|nr:hypothetical protein [Rhizomicrobium sp.]